MVEPRISGQLGQVKIESNGQGLVWLAKFFLKVFFFCLRMCLANNSLRLCLAVLLQRKMGFYKTKPKKKF